MSRAARSPWLLLPALLIMTLWSIPGISSEHADNGKIRNIMTSWTSVEVSVADLDEALALWSGFFGLEVKALSKGDDPELARLWGIRPDDIKRQALLGTPGADTGLIHFVQFSQPGPAVREGAEAFDLCPKNLDVYARDLPSRVEELKKGGYRFRNQDYSEVTAPDGTVFREIHLPGHDAINIVLLEVIGKALPFTPQGYAGVGPLITIVADAGAERGFYRDTLNLTVLNDNILEGPEIERMIGLPAGSALDVSIWGAEGEALGQMEVINYRGTEGQNLYPQAVPKQRGILQITYESENLSGLTGQLDQAGISWADLGKFSILSGSGRFIRFSSPAGLIIEVFQRNEPLN
jgi:catechol 2,3-dioxygenase-like lactoylglutathione lyase family enzyme